MGSVTDTSCTVHNYTSEKAREKSIASWSRTYFCRWMWIINSDGASVQMLKRALTTKPLSAPAHPFPARHGHISSSQSVSQSYSQSVCFTTCIKQQASFSAACEEALQRICLINCVSFCVVVVPGLLFMSGCKLCTAAWKQFWSALESFSESLSDFTKTDNAPWFLGLDEFFNHSVCMLECF